MQRGVDLPSLDVTYFTSLSYYILLLFGLRGVFMLFFRENTIDETQMYRQQMGMGGGANPMAAMTGADPNKALEAERAALEMVRSRCFICHDTRSSVSATPTRTSDTWAWVSARIPWLP